MTATRHHVLMTALIGLAAAFTGMFAGCSTNPATGRSQLAFFGRDWEIEIGQQAAPGLVEEFGGEVKDAELRAYVADIGARLARHTEADFPSLPWTFTLLDSDVINAFALPGGKVFFSRGLAARMTDEAQMAGVLGHEIGHVTARHTAERISQVTLIQGAVQIAGVAADSAGGSGAGQLLPALNVGGQLVTLKFGRDQESEADSLGLRYMSKENYNPWAMLKVMEILKEASGGEGSSEWMSTHPLPETRIQRITQELQRDYAFTRDNPEYQFHEQRYRERFLRRLATRPPPSDPRASTPLAIDLSDPSAWCSLCAAQPSVAHSERQGP